MKKTVKLIALCLVLTLAFLLVACKSEEPPIPSGDGGDTLTLVIEGDFITEYTVPLSNFDTSAGVLGLIAYLSETGALSYEMNGTMLSKIGELTDGDGGKYIYVFTTISSETDVSRYAKTVEYNGMTITSAGYGISSLTVAPDAVIYITLVEFS